MRRRVSGCLAAIVLLSDDAFAQAEWASSFTSSAVRAELLSQVASGSESRHTDQALPRRHRRLADVTEPISPAPAGQRCTVVQDALHEISPEFATIVDRIVPLAAPPDDNWLFFDVNATITVLIPPRTHLNGIIYGFDQDALKASEVWDIISLHVIPELVDSDALVQGEGRLIPTLNAGGQQLRLSLSLSDTSGQGANSNAPAGTVGITEADINACAPGSTMHAIGSMLFPDDFLLPPEGQPRALDAGDGGDDGGMSTWGFVGIGVAIIACLLSCILGAVCYRRKLQRERERDEKIAATEAHGKAVAAAVEAAEKPLEYKPVPLDVMSSSTRGRPSTAGGSAVALHGSDAAVGFESSMASTRETALRTSDGVGLTTFGMTAAGTLDAPKDGAEDDEIKAWVEHQLDSLGDMPLLQRFVLLGGAERRAGGQAIVQFARSVRDRGQYALKFFISRASFDAERSFYSDSPLGQLLPRLEGMVDNADGAVQDAQGHPLPPFVIMERGESLDEWSRRRKPDMWAAMPVLANIAKRLEAMHDAGYAHRDLKPANVMWLPRENQWTLIDFGAAGRIGEEVPLSFTFAYAAPEVLAALQEGRTSVTAAPAVDAWALGVMVFELLTGRPAFEVFLQGRDKVIAQVRGEQPAPWDVLSDGDRRKLGAFRGPVLKLLSRDAAQRPTMPQFYDSCNAIFATSTTFAGKAAPAPEAAAGSAAAPASADAPGADGAS